MVVGCGDASDEGEPWAGEEASTSDAPTSEDPPDEDPPDEDPPDEDDGTTGGEDDGSTGDEPDPTDTADGSTGDEPEPPSGLGCEGRDDLLLCDDFEDGSIDGAQWTVIEDNGVEVSIDEEFSYHGGGSLRISLPSANAARGGLVHTGAFPVPDNHFFGRAWFYVGPTAPQTHSAALAATGQLDGAAARYRLDSNGGTFNSRYTHNPTVEQHGGLRKFGYDVPVEQWLCIEWEYDGPGSTMRYWMDGEEVEDMTVTAESEEQEWIAPIFDSFEIGWRTYQAAEPTDVYWDSMALASTRIGCE